MSDLLKRYENSDRDGVVKAREQSEGGRSVNYFDLQNDFSENFKTRSPGRTEVQLESDPQRTGGQFTERARNYYDEELKEITNPNLQKFNRANKYLDGNNALGAVYQSTPADK